jgi:perosamine synthetase
MEKEINELIKVLKTQKFSLLLGNIVSKFEKEFAEYIGVKHAIAVNSGLAARDISFASLDLKTNTEIIIPPFTSVATANSILQSHGVPIFADIDDRTFTLDPKSVQDVITDKTKAIVPIHLAGVPADMDELIKIAQENELYIIEDLSQSLGSEYKGKKVGSLGDLGAFTFYPSKGLNVSEGGIITTNDDTLAEKCRLLVQQGEYPGYIYTRLGWNYRMTDIQAGVCRVQLKNLENNIKIRNKNWYALTTAVKEINGIDSQYVPEYCEPAFSYWIGRIHPEILGMEKEQFIENFSKEKIFHPTLLYTTKLFQEKIDYSKIKLPIAEKVSKEIFAFDIYPDIASYEMAENINVMNILARK